MAKKSLQELKTIIADFKALAMSMSSGVGSGHVGGAMSSAEYIIAGWFSKLNIPDVVGGPGWEDRDRFFVGQGHITPGVYSLLVQKGYYKWQDTAGYRKYGSPFQGHPDRNLLKGWEMSSGSLGQALGVAVGCALAAKLAGKSYRVATLNSDGELQEGSMWEAIMLAGAQKLDNLVTFIDYNRIQNYNRIEQTADIHPLTDKFRAFNWDVIEINGNDLEQVLDAYDKALVPGKGKPTVIIGHTKIGNGVSFMYDKVDYHSKAPPREDLPKGIQELGSNFPHQEYLKLADEYGKKVAGELNAKMPKFSRDYGWNKEGDMMKTTLVWTGEGISAAMRTCMDKNPKVMVCTDDSHKLIGLNDKDMVKYKASNQYIDVGCAEQNMAVVSAGLAKEGFIPMGNGYTGFCIGRAYDHIRTSILTTNFNVKYFPTEGLLGGDGLLHEGLEGIALTYYLPNWHVSFPCDNIEARKASITAISEINGPVVTFQERAPKPSVTKEETPYKFGVANIIRYRGRQAQFADAFETKLSTEWKPEKADLAIIACSSMVAEAMRAAYILKEEKGIETIVVNLHTIKPLDKAGIIKAVQGVKAVITHEQHAKGGLGNIIAGVILEGGLSNVPKLKMIGIENAFGQTAKPWELIQHYGLTAEHVATTALDVLGVKANAPVPA